MALSPAGTHFAIGGYRSAQLYDAATGAAIGPTLPHLNSVHVVVFSPDGGRLLTGSVDQTARVWSVPDGQPVGPVLQHRGRVYRAAFSPDGDRLVIVPESSATRVWAIPPGNPRDASFGVGGGGGLATLSSDGAYVLPRGMSYHLALHLHGTQVYHAATGRPAGPGMAVNGSVTDAAFAPGDRQIAVLVSRGIGKSGNLQFWDWKAGRLLRPAIEMPAEPRALAYRPDGKQLAVICSNGTVLLLDPADGRTVRELSVGKRMDFPGDWVSNGRVRYSPDGRQLAAWVGVARSGVHFWDADSGKAPFSALPEGHDIAFSPDGRWVTMSQRVYEARTGKQVASLPHPIGTFAVRFTGDGQYLVTGGADGMARLWDWQKGQLVCPPMFQGDELYAVNVTPDGRWVVTGGSKSGRVFDARTGRPITPPIPLDGRALNVTLTPKGDRAIFSGFLSRVRIIDLGDLDERGELSTDELVLLGEVLSMQRLHESGIVEPLADWEWYDRWKRFHARWPHYFEPGQGKEGLDDVLRTSRQTRHEEEFARASAAGKWFAAAFHLSRLIEDSPKSWWLFDWRGQVHAEQGHWAAARRDYDRAVELDAEEAETLGNRALVLLAAEDMPAYRKACADLFERHGDAEDFVTLTALERAVVAGPDAARAERLIRPFRRLAERDRTCNPRHALGAVQYRAGKYREAIEALNEAVRLHPGATIPDCLYLAMAQHRLGKADEARQWLQKADAALAADPDLKGVPWQLRVVIPRLRREAGELLP
jgi:WD40 repeat protein/Flp pilus assembly protein TadD